MSDEESPQFASAGSSIAWLSYNVRVEFYPPIKITTKAGHEFAGAIHSAMEAGLTNVEGNEWILRGARAYDGMTIAVGKQSVKLSVVEPQNVQEWYEERFTAILDAFGRLYKPKIALAVSAMANGLVNVSGDARAFLGGNLTFMHPKKLEVIKRPLHILGIRLFFPPFDDGDTGKEEKWGVDVRAESWIDDPEKLYLEADADWHESETWAEETPRELVAKLKMVTDFMNTRLLDFLHQHPFTGFDEEENEDGDGDEEL